MFIDGAYIFAPGFVTFVSGTGDFPPKKFFISEEIIQNMNIRVIIVLRKGKI
jgi:hypothetical protein